MLARGGSWWFVVLSWHKVDTTCLAVCGIWFLLSGGVSSDGGLKVHQQLLLQVTSDWRAVCLLGPRGFFL